MTSAVDWICAGCTAPLVPHDIGTLETPSGRIAMLDPLAFSGDFDAFAFKVPTTGGRLVVFEDYRVQRYS